MITLALALSLKFYQAQDVLTSQLLREIVEEHYHEYEAANQKKGVVANAEKMVVVRKVLAGAEALGVRFLIQEPDGSWSLAPPEKVYDKITQNMRNLRWAKKNKPGV